MNMNQFLQGFGRLQQGVTTGRHLAETGANGQNQIRLSHTLGQSRADANAHITGILGMVVVEGVLKTECVGNRQLPVFSEALERLGSLYRPPPTTANDQGLLSRQQEVS